MRWLDALDALVEVDVIKWVREAGRGSSRGRNARLKRAGRGGAAGQD